MKAKYKLHAVSDKKDRTLLHGILLGIAFTVVVEAIVYFLVMG